MITVTTDGGAAIVERLRSFPDRLRARLSVIAQRLSTDLESRVLGKLQGGVLQSRSGRLARALALDAETTEEGIAIRLSVDPAEVPYAGFQEYGFRGTETVGAHLRTIRKVFGRPVAPHQVTVRSYTRRVDYPAHSFLRSALAGMAPDIEARIKDAVADTVNAS